MRKRSLNCTFVRLEGDNKADSVLVNAYSLRLAEARRLIYGLLCLTLLILNGCQSQKIWHSILNCVVDIAPSRFNFEEDHKKISIPVVASHPLDKTNHDTDYLIIMIHGGGLNVESSFETAAKVIERLKNPKNHFLVLAPQFIEGVELDETGLLFWDQEWKGGGLSLSTGLNDGLPSLSSFEVIDRLSIWKVFGDGYNLYTNVSALKSYGLVKHTIWIEKQNDSLT